MSHPRRANPTRNPLVIGGVIFALSITLLGLFSPIIGPYNSTDQQLRLRHAPPWSSGIAIDRTTDPRREEERFFVLGTDHLGRDYLSRLLLSFRVSAFIGLLAWGLGTIFAWLLIASRKESASLLAQRKSFPWSILDSSVLVLAALGLGINYLLFSLLLLTLPWLGSALPHVLTFWPMIILWAILIAPVPASLLYQAVIRDSTTQNPTSTKSIFRKTLLLAPVSLSLAVLISIFVDFSWSFFGFGVRPPSSSLGLLIVQGRQYLVTAWWVALIPTGLLFMAMGALFAIALPIRRSQIRWESQVNAAVNGPEAMEVAPVRSRIGSLIFDLILLWLLKSVWWLVTLFLILIVWMIPYVNTLPFNPLSSKPVYFLWAVYLIFFWARSGQTPGMRLIGIKVIRTDGSSLSVTRAVLRLIGFIVSVAAAFLGFIWILFDAKKQGWHDKIADTLVIRADNSKS